MKVIYPGSFHPPTLGHLDIIRRASTLFDEVIVAVMLNPDKRYLLTDEDRIRMLRECTKKIKNVRVIADDGLLADLCAREKADAILKGLRDAADYTYEAQMAEANRVLGAPETIYITSAPEYRHISSTIASDVARHGGNIALFVPAVIAESVGKAFKR